MHRSDGRTTVRQTCDFSFERAAHYVLRSSVFDGDEIVARRHGSVSDLVALRTLTAVQFDFGRPVDVHRESAGASLAGFDDKFRRHTCGKG